MLSFLALAAAVVVLSALCSMSEAAYLSLPLVRARALAKLGGRTAQAVLRIREKVQYAVSAIVILNTVVNLVGMSLIVLRAQAIGAAAADQGDIEAVIAAWITPLLTVVVVIFGEIVPKAIGERFHVGIAMAAAYPVMGLIGLFHPVVWGTEKLVDSLFPRRRRSVTTEEEISAMAEEASRAVVARYFGDILESSMVQMGLEMSLDQISNIVPDMLTPGLLATINNELAQVS